MWEYQISPGYFIKRADVNQDGVINSSDVDMVLKFSAHLQTPTDLQFKLADVNGDGFVKSSDAQKIQRYVNKLDSKFPADINED